MVRKTPSCATVSSISSDCSGFDDDGLELWEPVFKAKFPISREKIEVHLVHFSKGSESKEESEDNHVVTTDGRELLITNSPRQ